MTEDNETFSRLRRNNDITQRLIWLENGVQIDMETFANDIRWLLADQHALAADVSDEELERACEDYEGPHNWEFQTDTVKANTRQAMLRSLNGFKESRTK